MKRLINPKQLFLIDGLGALLSALLLGVVLVRLEGCFGIPPPTLYLLAVFPCCFAAYDYYCYSNAEQHCKIQLTRIATANLLYCCLSIGLAIYHSNTLTLWGWSYLLGELIIVITLAIIELRVAQNNHKRKMSQNTNR